MVKSVCSMLCVFILLIVGAVCENGFVIKQFEEFEAIAEELYEKTEEHVSVKDDAVALQDNWLDKKKYLHNFVPHTEIKEMDLWISEAITLIEEENWDDALPKIKVIKDLALRIPDTFKISLENIL